MDISLHMLIPILPVIFHFINSCYRSIIFIYGPHVNLMFPFSVLVLMYILLLGTVVIFAFNK
jgi:hypothetical protein